MNSVNLIGNLTRDPELRTAGDTAVASLRLAVNGRRKVGDDWVDEPNYFNVTVWGRQAELAGQFLTRGRQIAVSGRLRWHEWETDAVNEKGDRVKRQEVEIVAEHLDYLREPKERELQPAVTEAADDVPSD